MELLMGLYSGLISVGYSFIVVAITIIGLLILAFAIRYFGLVWQLSRMTLDLVKKHPTSPDVLIDTSVFGWRFLMVIKFTANFGGIVGCMDGSTLEGKHYTLNSNQWFPEYTIK
ncbi:hypothetical protein AB4254_10975 [Vibrio breoganii]